MILKNLVQGYPNPIGGYGLCKFCYSYIMFFQVIFCVLWVLLSVKICVYISYVCFSILFDPPGLSSESFGSVRFKHMCMSRL